MGEPSGPEAVVRRWLDDVWSQGNLDAVDHLVADPYIRHDHRGTRRLTPAEYKEEMAQYLDAIRSATATIDDLAVAGDRVWARVTSRGVDLQAESAVTITWMQVHRVAGDRIAESWVMYRTDLDWT